jgi:hypothetical protein
MDVKEIYVINTYLIRFTVYLTTFQQLSAITELGERLEGSVRSVFKMMPRDMLGKTILNIN